MSKQKRSKTRKLIEILMFIDFNVNLIIAVGGVALAGV